MPADRVFGRTEKMLRKKPSITTKEEYYTVYEQVGEIRKLGVDWTLCNANMLSNNCLKTIDHISDKKRMFIKKKSNLTEKIQIRIKSTEYYRFQHVNEVYTTLLKRGWNWERITEKGLSLVPMEHDISEAKKKDVDDLLKKILVSSGEMTTY